MEKDRIQKSGPHTPEESYLEDFFKAFNLCFNYCAMYFREHAAFQEGIQKLKDQLDKLSKYRKVLEFSVTPDHIVLDGKQFRGEAHYCKNIAHFLHERKVKSLKINTGVSPQKLGDFVFNLASCLKQIREGKSLREIFKNLEGIEVEELDYSFLLASRGKYSQDMWRALLNKDQARRLSSETITYVIENLGGIIDEIASEEDILQNVLNTFEDLIQSKTTSFEEKIQHFSKSLGTALFRLPQEFLEIFLARDKFPDIKNIISGSLDKNALLQTMLKQIVENKQFNSLFLNVYNIIANDNKTQEELAQELNNYIDKSSSVNDRQKILQSLKELLLNDPSNQFISTVYKNTLSKISSQPSGLVKEGSSLEVYLKELSDEGVETHYLYTLLELLEIENDANHLKLLVTKLKAGLPFIVKTMKLEIIKNLIKMLEEKISSSDASLKIILGSLYKDICSPELLNLILLRLENFQDFETLKLILKKVKGGYSQILGSLFQAKDTVTYEALKKMIIEMTNKDTVALLKNYLSQNPNTMVLREAIDILAKVKAQEALDLLKEIYRTNKNRKIIQVEVLKAMKSNPFKDKKFLEQFLFSKEILLRKEAMAAFSEVATREEKVFFAKKIFDVNNFLGLKNNSIMENIDSLSGCCLEEIAPFLLRYLSQSPIFFKDSWDQVRIKSLELLIDNKPQEIRNLLPQLLKDKNEKIRMLASKLEAKWKT